MAEEQSSLAKIEQRKKEYRYYRAYKKQPGNVEVSHENDDKITVGRAINFDKLKNGLIKKYVEEELNLEDLQQESIFKITDTVKGDYSLSSGYFHACTGFGKTYLMMAMVEGYRSEEKNKKIVIFEQNQAVLEQVKKDFIEKSSFSEDDIGVFYAKEKNVDKPIIICTYASMGKLIQQIGKANIGLALCDEAHHVLSENRKEVAKELATSCLYGFTATPSYDEDKHCARVFGNLVDSVTIEEGVKSGLLCGVKNGLLVSKVEVDLSRLHKTTDGEYVGEELVESLNKISGKHGIKEALADFYLSGYDESVGVINGKPTIINTPSRKEADALVKIINKKAGKVIAKSYHSGTTEKPLKEFNKGKFPVLVQVNRISEGYNNSKVEICINYPTASQVRETQCGGRTLRYDSDNPLKMALVLDIVFMQDKEGNIYDEAHKNKQVLFKDITGQYYLTSEEFEKKKLTEEKKRSRGHTKDENSSYYNQNNNSLFDLKLGSKELYMVNWGYENILRERENLREIRDTDILKDDFINKALNFRVYYKDENSEKEMSVASQNVKRLIWNALKKTGYNIITEVRCGDEIVSVLPKENMKMFREWIEEIGGHIWDIDRDKLPTDVTKEEFLALRKYFIHQHGKKIHNCVLNKLWDDLDKNNFLINTVRHEKVLPLENIPAVQEWVKDKDIEIFEYQRLKRVQDVDKELFSQYFRFKNRRGRLLTVKEKLKIWDKLEKTTDMVIRVLKDNNVMRILPKENWEKLNIWLKEEGLKAELFITERSKTDIDQYTFVYGETRHGVVFNWDSEKVLNAKEKEEIWQQMKQENLLRLIVENCTLKPVLAVEDIPAFNKTFAERGMGMTSRGGCGDINQDAFCASSYMSLGWSVSVEIKDKQGKILSYNEKQELWKMLAKERDIVIGVTPYIGKVMKVLPEENIEKAKKFFSHMGLSFDYQLNVFSRDKDRFSK